MPLLIFPARRRGAGMLVVLAAFVSGCATYVVPEAPEAPFRARAATRADAVVRISAAALGAAESEAWFATPLATHGIQPVWVQVHNAGEDPLVLNLLAIDPDYFSPSEAAWRSRGPGQGGMDDKQAYFNEQHIALVVPPGASTSGFIYTNLDPGLKPVSIELIGSHSAHVFDLLLDVPGMRIEFDSVTPTALYAAGEIREIGFHGLRDYLATLPCCARPAEGGGPIEPINLALVGPDEHLLTALVRRGWDVIGAGAAGEDWPRAGHGGTPVLFGRHRDVSLAKSRPAGSQRTRMVMWRAPVTVDGQPVWVGRVGRELGAGPDEPLDPVLDEARTYVLLDLYDGREISRAGYAPGVGRATLADPHPGPGGGTVVTDGLRLVLFVTASRSVRPNVEWLDWERPPARMEELLAAPGGTS